MADEHQHAFAFRGTVDWGGQRYKLFVCDDTTCNQEFMIPAGDGKEGE